MIMATPQDEIYIAVRESEGKEWIDLTSWGYVELTARDSADNVDGTIPQWAEKNPIVRIAKFKLAEIKP
jgi:hypothetical protein